MRSLPAGDVIEVFEEPQGKLLFFHTDQPGFSFAVRPSGTEPKIKFYFFGYGQCRRADDLPEVKRETNQRLDQLRREVMRYVDDALSEFPLG